VARFDEPSTTQELTRNLAFARDHGDKIACIGRGSNILGHDRGWPGTVIRIGSRMNSIRRKNDVLEVDAGLKLASLIRHCSADGVLDLTQCVGIPGTVGGAVAMNAGTRWGDISSRIRWVDCFDIGRDNTVRLPYEDIDFGYRRSSIQGAGLVVTSVGFSLSDPGTINIQELLRGRLRQRAQIKLPVSRCAGSFFKNPQGASAGALIDRCGLKGNRIGGAMVSPLHANYLVNTGEATSSDFQALIHTIRRRVFEAFGTTLELEVRLLGFHPEEAAQLGGRLA